MENAKVPNIPCPLHPSECIQTVNIDINASQLLNCMECVLKQREPNFDTSTLISINDLIAIADEFYQDNKDRAKISEGVPSDYAESLSREAENVEKLSKHIEEQKKIASDFFNTLTKDFVRAIEDKKNEYLTNLDQQLFNLRYWYIFFDKQIKRAYPLPEDIQFLFPSKEDLTNKLHKISDSTELMEFVKNIKEDLNEQKFDTKADQKKYLDTLMAELIKIENTKPVFNNLDSALSEIKNSLKEILEESLDKLLYLEKPINDIIGKDYDSKLLKFEQFYLLKSWITQDYKFNLKLLYRGSRDGMNASAFHSNCDGKGATVTIIKCQWYGTDKVSYIGGFLDQNWNQTGEYIDSSKAFLFSLSKNVKCPISNSAYAGQSSANYGPIFGGGNDLYVGFNQNHVYPHSYTDTMKLVETPNYAGGLAHFKLIDLEVYLVS